MKKKKSKQLVTNYYLRTKNKWIKLLSKLEICLEDILKTHFSKEIVKNILSVTRDKFIKILPDLPYIGKNNHIIESLIGAAYEMGLYEILEKKGLTLKKISYINQRALYDFTKKRINPFTLYLIKNFAMTRKNYKKGALLSQKKTYHGDWVYEYIEPGKEETFDIGINFTECGIVKLLKKFGKEKYLPFICLNDYATYGAMGIKLERTKTIGNGAAYCDFRFKLKEKIEITKMEFPKDLS
jgi:hypothetical protein